MRSLIGPFRFRCPPREAIKSKPQCLWDLYLILDGDREPIDECNLHYLHHSNIKMLAFCPRPSLKVRCRVSLLWMKVVFLRFGLILRECEALGIIMQSFSIAIPLCLRRGVSARSGSRSLDFESCWKLCAVETWKLWNRRVCALQKQMLN